MYTHTDKEISTLWKRRREELLQKSSDPFQNKAPQGAVPAQKSRQRTGVNKQYRLKFLRAVQV